MKQPRLLDAFCGAGGGAVGLHRAGFEVVGVDIEPQPHYPFEFHQADALEFPLEGFDAYWASPPCQAFTFASKRAQKDYRYEYPDLITPTRERLEVMSKPYVIENVIGAPLIDPVRLCGIMFGLKLFRHRVFESNIALHAPFHPKHNRDWLCGRDYFRILNGGCWLRGNERKGTLEQWEEAMGIDWMTRKELTQAIPPAYSEYLGKQILALIEGE